MFLLILIDVNSSRDSIVFISGETTSDSEVNTWVYSTRS